MSSPNIPLNVFQPLLEARNVYILSYRYIHIYTKRPIEFFDCLVVTTIFYNVIFLDNSHPVLEESSEAH